MQRNKEKVTFAGGAVTLLGNEVKIGDKAQDFALLGEGLKEVKLSDFEGKVKVLSVFPSVDTGICSIQTKRFNKEADALSDDIQILTISNDLPFALSRYCAAEGIDKLTSLSDHRDLDFGLKYGFAIEELRLLARGVVVLDKNNEVKYVEYVPEITNEPDYDSALKVAKELV